MVFCFPPPNPNPSCNQKLKFQLILASACKNATARTRRVQFNICICAKKRFFVVVVAGTEIFRLKIATCIQINLFEMENFHSPPRVRDYVMAQIFSSPRQIELADNWRKLSKRQPWHRNFGCGAREAWCGSCGARSTSIVEHFGIGWNGRDFERARKFSELNFD